MASLNIEPEPETANATNLSTVITTFTPTAASTAPLDPESAMGRNCSFGAWNCNCAGMVVRTALPPYTRRPGPAKQHFLQIFALSVPCDVRRRRYSCPGFDHT